VKPLVVVGDVILDIDVEGGVDRFCPDAPAPVLTVTDERARPGGAALAAALVAGRGTPVHLVTALEDDADGRRLRGLLAGTVDLLAGPATGGTVTKCRWRCGGRSLLRTDRGEGRPGPGFAAAVAGPLETVLHRAGGVLVSDYGRGVTADPMVWDPHPRGCPPVPGVTLVTPSLAEARAAVVGVDPPVAGPVPAALDLAGRLVQRWDARAVAVTLGAGGAVVRHRRGACSAAPAPVVEGSDPCGAGDHFAGGVAARLAAGAIVDEAVIGAVAGAAAFVSRGGGASVGRAGDRWTQPAPPGPHPPRRAATGLEPALRLAGRVRAAGGTVVAAGGTFDLLHTGHLRTLAAARALGDCLVVLVNSDESARRRAGPAAPAVALEERVDVLAALDGVDAVAVFDADDPRSALRALRPDLWVKGADHDPAELPETPLVRSWGGEVVVVPYRSDRRAVHPDGAPRAGPGAHRG
jgi:D-beta-D-heptose 7-phosphate kinase/D-beta-D-heptose 1-phosphate adenosyltransferase